MSEFQVLARTRPAALVPGADSTVYPIYKIGPDVASLVADILNTWIKVNTYEKVMAARNGWRSNSIDICTKYAEFGPMPPEPSDLLKEIMAQYDELDNLLKGGIVAGLGGSLVSYVEHFSGIGQLQYAYKTMMINTSIIPRMRRYWNYIYHPNYLDTGQGWRAWRQDIWTKETLIKAMQMEGWTPELSETLLKIMSSLPTPREAFYLWMKDQIDDKRRDALFFAGGWEPEWYPKLMENWYEVPTLRNLINIAETTSLPQTWSLKQLRRMGFKDEDAARLWNMLKKKPIISEQRAIASQWIWRRINSRCSTNDLQTALTELDISPEEVALLVEKAELQREDELINEQVEIFIGRFRLGWITDTELLADLESLGIEHEKANLIVETQKALGYLGGYGT